MFIERSQHAKSSVRPEAPAPTHVCDTHFSQRPGETLIFEPLLCSLDRGMTPTPFQILAFFLHLQAQGREISEPRQREPGSPRDTEGETCHEPLSLGLNRDSSWCYLPA